MSRISWVLGLALALASCPAAAEVLVYRITGTLQKDAMSDRLFGAATDRVRFEIHLEADTSLASRVPAGTMTSLPNFPRVTFAEDGFAFPRAALKSLSFRLSSGEASFSTSDVIADPSVPGAIFLTGTLSKPTRVNLLLANAASGYFEIGMAKCTSSCRLEGGIVLDQAGPFGTIEEPVVTVAPRP